MTKTAVVRFFGSQKALCESLGRHKSTVSNWPEQLPRGIQFEIQVKTNGALKADQAFFNDAAK